MNSPDITLEFISAPQLQKLLEISTLLSSTLDLSKLLGLVIEAAADLTDTEEASLLLMDPQSKHLQFVAVTGNQNLMGMLVPIEHSLAGSCVQQGKPLTINEVQSNDRHFKEVGQVTQKATNSMVIVPLFYKDKVIGVLEAINKREGYYTSQDVTVLQALASQAAIAIENARLFQQTDVISEIMHELKTPLMAFKAATELLLRPNLPEAKRQHIVQTLKQEAERLARMTQDFLELSRLDSGRVRIEWHEVDLLRLIQEIADIQRPQASQRGITIELEHPEQLPLIKGDANRLKQVLLNLVSNAIKYNLPDGKITLRLVLAEPEITISVCDTGPGISPENLSRLFDRFYRVPGSEGYSEGTGLGLSIAQKIIESHHGRILVESEVGKGTIFHCVLKVDGSEEASK
jgi:signal transduction histidine kinase